MIPLDTHKLPRYTPRTLVIFLAGNFYHTVEEWTALDTPVDEGVSPGR